MDDAYTIGITLALENGVSEGIGIIRRDLQALDLALGQSTRALTGLRRASDAGLGSARLDVARLTAEGRQALGRSPNTAPPAPSARPAMVRAEQPESLPQSEENSAPRGSAAAAFSPSAPPRVRKLPEEPARAMPLSVPPPAFPPLPPNATAKPAPPEVSIAPVPFAARADSGPPTSAAPVASPNPSRASLSPTPSAPPGPPASMAPMPPARMLPSAAESATAPSNAMALAPPPAAPASGSNAMDLAGLVRSLVPKPTQLPTFPLPQLSRFTTPALSPPAEAIEAQRQAGAAARSSSAMTQERASVERIDVTLPVAPVGSQAVRSVPIREAVVPPRTSESMSRFTGTQREAGPSSGDIYLDGHRVGRWMSDRLIREVERAPTGPTGFDPRASRIWPGMATQP